MSRKAYPTNWEDLARRCKERADFTCEHCGVKQHQIVTSRKGTPYFIYLHAAHKHHDKDNPQPELLCLCISCHARYDYQRKQKEARLRVETLKHLRLLIEQGVVQVSNYC